jgi:Fe2+ or Zn2+ uptake regulation protein
MWVRAGVTHLQITMTKRDVLEVFFRDGSLLTPDEICRQLGAFHHRSSVYSYLFRLHKQGLLRRGRVGSRVAYQISERGIERLKFLMSVYNNGSGFAQPG